MTVVPTFRRAGLCAAAVSCIALLCVAAFAPAASPLAPPDGAGELPYYVRLAPGSETRALNALAATAGRVTHRLDRFRTLAVMMPPSAAAELRNSPGVELVEPVPEHALFTQVVPYTIDQVQARHIWDADRDGEIDFGAPDGSGVRLCIIDSGYHAAHDDLAAVAVDGMSQIAGESWTEDGYGHGTHVAGTASAVANDIGVVGVTPGAVELLVAKIFDNNGDWLVGQSNLGAAAEWCRDHGADVISMSLGGPASSTEEAIFQSLYDDGILNVAAAGNDGNAAASPPASYDSVISVGALNDANLHAAFSQFPASVYDPDNPPPNEEWDAVELAAGGVGVLSTLPAPDGAVPVYRVDVDGMGYQAGHIQESGLGSVAGDLVDGGLCAGPGVAWPGRIVLCARGEVDFSVKIDTVAAGGGLAALIYNNVPGSFTGTCDGNCSSQIPALSLSLADGQALLATALGSSAQITADDGSSCVDCSGGYGFASGTSMATPAVAAGAALVWNSCRNGAGITNKELRRLLRDSALDLAGTSTGGDSYGAGWDPYTGFGLLQIDDAFQLGRQRFGSTCSLALAVTPAVHDICTSDHPSADFAVTLGPDFQATTALQTSGLPGAASAVFAPQQIVWPNQESTLTVGNLGSLADGEYPFTVLAEDTLEPARAATEHARLVITTAAPATPVPLSPPHGATEQPIDLLLSWSEDSTAVGWSLEIARDTEFSRLVAATSTLEQPSYAASGLPASTELFWRVTAHNGCGTSQSATRSFTTLTPPTATLDVDPVSLAVTRAATATPQVVKLEIQNNGSAELAWFTTDLPTWRDDFDAYATDSNLHGQGGWKGWDDDPAAGAFIRNSPVSSAPNSLEIRDAADIVREFAGIDSGQWTLSAKVFTPSTLGRASFFMLLNTYTADGPNNWSAEVRFVGSGIDTVISDNDGARLPLITDTWVDVRVEIDLDRNIQTFYYGGDLLYQKSWTEGLSGEGEARLAAIELFANTSTSVFWDDFDLRDASPCTLPLGEQWLSFTPDSGTLGGGTTQTVAVSVGDPALEIGEYEAAVCLDSNAGSRTVPVTLQVVPAPEANLGIALDGLAAGVLPGDLVNILVEVGNTGPNTAEGASVELLFPPELSACSWSCTPAGGASCASGTISGDLIDTPSLPVGSSISYTASCTVEATATAFEALHLGAEVAPPSGVVDPEPGNNQATASACGPGLVSCSDPSCLIACDGFWSGDTSRWSSQQP